VCKATATEHSKSEKFLLSSQDEEISSLWGAVWIHCEHDDSSAFCIRAFKKVRFFPHQRRKKPGSSVLVCILHYYYNPCLHNGAK
jgi:hypothetical protein